MLDERSGRLSNTVKDAGHFDAVIIGAGFSGLYQLLRLRDHLGLRTVVLEMADGVGGTWHWNRYPGARCDSESHSYCYYFDDALLRDWEWTERYPGHEEIRRYLNHVADRYRLRPDIRLNTRVSGARYDDGRRHWVLDTEGGERLTSRFLITAVGCLSAANIPDVPGLGRFAGRWYHTGQWPHEGVDFRGRRVAMIGTGSTGIQCAPEIAETAAHLTVFQRTANYSLPANNGPLSEAFRQYLREHSDEVREVMRSTTNGHPFRICDRSAFDVTPQEREAIYEEAWRKGGLQFRASFRDLMSDQAANDTAAEFIKAKIRRLVADPLKAAILSDIDHPFAAKRPPIDTNYFETFNRSNVSLVDLRTNPIEAIVPQGIQTREAMHEADILVFATGFDALTGPLLRIGIEGRNGLTLADAWRAGPRNHLGLQVPGFPNLFTITGPGSPSVLCNMPVAIEQHVDWITACIDHMRRNGLATVESTDAAADAWTAQVQSVAEGTLLPKARHSWYLGANIPGKPRVFMPYAGGLARYRGICEQVVERGYEGFVFGP